MATACLHRSRGSYVCCCSGPCQVLSIVKSGKLCGQAVIRFLQDSGYPEVALLFEQDPETKLELALKCGRLDVARTCATEINSPAAWNQLAKAALWAGDYDLVSGKKPRPCSLHSG